MAVETITPATATHTIVHYEIPAEDTAKLTSFYSSVFGWTFATTPMMETYHLAQAGEGDDAIGLAVFPRENAGAKPVNYIRVESVKTYADKVKQHGGTVLHTFSVPGMGHGAVALDPEGNMVGLWEPDMSATEAFSNEQA